LRHPGAYISLWFAVPVAWLDALVLSIFLGLMVRPWYAFSFALFLLGFDWFSDTILRPELRHEGLVLCFIVTLFWLALSPWENPAVRWPRYARMLTIGVLLFGLVPVFATDVSYATGKFREDRTWPLSASQALGNFINTNSDLQDAIVIGEPDYLFSPVRYYTRNRLYNVRENRFTGYPRYVVKGVKEVVTLGDLLHAAERLSEEYQVPVLIVLGVWDMAEQGKNYVFREKFGRNFRATSEERTALLEKTIKIARFDRALTDERFQLFLYPKHGDRDRYLKAFYAY
jgi:hypothetical protein